MTILKEIIAAVSNELQRIPQAKRALIYRVCMVAAFALVTFGVIVEGDAQEYLNLAAAVLGVPVQALAAANTPRNPSEV